ncbi:MAG: DUF58 domain-containing protein [Clostridiales bacterium]|nr:DUF58 domain-containing protein [Clostridiales bacterium]
MIVYLLMLVAVGVAVELWSIRHALDGIEYDLKLSAPLVEPGEPFEMIMILTNRKRRFMPFIRVDENVPTGLVSERPLTMENYTEQRSLLSGTVYLMPRQRLTRRTRVSMERRGRILFKGATLYGGDFLGLREKPMTVETQREVVVLPKALDAATVEAVLGGTLGDVSVQRFLFEDPMITLGFHEYTGREPMKQIAWAQSARAGGLMVRTYDHTAERCVTLLLNADTFAFGSYGEQMLEICYSLTRALCERLEEMRIPYTFLTNAQMDGLGDGTGEVADGLGKAHLNVVLESLGRASYAAREHAENMVERAASHAERGRRFIYITPVRDDLHRQYLDRLREATGEPPLTIVAQEVSL